jgi:hypothetical protein
MEDSLDNVYKPKMLAIVKRILINKFAINFVATKVFQLFFLVVLICEIYCHFFCCLLGNLDFSFPSHYICSSITRPTGHQPSTNPATVVK